MSGCEPGSHGPTCGLPDPDSDPGVSRRGLKGPTRSAPPGAHPAAQQAVTVTPAGSTPDVAPAAGHGEPLVLGAGTGTDEAAVAGNESGWEGAGLWLQGRVHSGRTGLCCPAPGPCPPAQVTRGWGMLVLAVGQAGGFKSLSQGIWETGALCAEGWLGAGCQGLSPLQGTLHRDLGVVSLGISCLYVSPHPGVSTGSARLVLHPQPLPQHPINFCPGCNCTPLCLPGWHCNPQPPTPPSTAPCTPFLAGTAPRGPVPAGAAPNSPSARVTAPLNPVPGGGCTPQACYPRALHPIAL